MAGAGVVAEVAAFLARGDVAPEAASALGLAEIREHLAGRLSIDEALARIAVLTKQFAKRQATFFKHFRSATWIDVPPDVDAATVADAVTRAYEAATSA